MIVGFHSFSMRGSAGAAPSLQEGKRLLRAAAGVEQKAALVGNADLRRMALTRGEMRFEQVGQVMHIDDRGSDARQRETVEHVVDERPACERHEGLRHGQGQGTHALAEPRGQHHRRLRLGGARLTHGIGPGQRAKGGSLPAGGNWRS